MDTRRLTSIAGALATEEIGYLPAEALAAEVIELRRAVDLLEVAWAKRVALLEDAGVLQLEGHTSATAFLKHRCRMSGIRARRSVALANRLSSLPHTVKAFQAGDVSLDQVREITAIPERLNETTERDEAMLVDAVADLSVHNTRRLVDYWKTAVDGPGEEAESEWWQQQRYLHASHTLGGMVKIDGLFDPLSGEVILEALAAATPPGGQCEERTPRQRRADALIDIARSFLDSGQAAGTEKPHLTLLTDLDALQGRGGGTHETLSGKVLTPGQIRQTGCDATITRIVFGPHRQPLDVGRATRIIPPAIRRAVTARDRHCQHRGCDRPAQWCDIHHIIHWADGGPTSTDNLQLLCRHHHTRQHRHANAHSP